MQFGDQQKLTTFLKSDESILWTGRSPGGFLLSKSDAFLFSFSLACGGFAMFWELSVYRLNAQSFFLLFGGAFVLAGLYLIIGRFFYDILKRKGTIYGLTNERALILAGVFGESLKSVDLKSISEVTLQIKSGGRGSIIFGSINGTQPAINNLSWPGFGPVFYPIPTIPKLNELLKKNIRNKLYCGFSIFISIKQ